jgi:hypothetical protein
VIILKNKVAAGRRSASPRKTRTGVSLLLEGLTPRLCRSGARAAISVGEQGRAPVPAERENYSSGLFAGLQRAITDFAADQPFAQVRMKLQEHYGFEIGESTIQRIALAHAKTIFEAGRVTPVFPEMPGQHKDIIAQPDGGMIPIVEPDARQKDTRKGKTLSWRETKVCMAHAQRSTAPVYAGTIEGGVEIAGRQLFDCALWAGFGTNFSRSCGRGWSALDRGPGGGAIWRPRQLLD